MTAFFRIASISSISRGAVVIRFSFPPHQARFVRLRQLEAFSSMWRISELTIHAPVSQPGKPDSTMVG